LEDQTSQESGRPAGTSGRLEATLYARIGPLVSGAGLDLIELRLGKGSRGLRIGLYIDRLPGNGRVTIEDCASVSRKISAVFELDDPMPGAWDLEVSSPGTNRRIRGAADALRFAGIRARLGLQEDLESGRETVLGTIVGADDEAVTVKVDGGSSRVLPWSSIRRAALDPTPEQWLELGRRATLEQETMDENQQADDAQMASAPSTASDDVQPQESAR
jgi:ribosome maturation factor RimP